MQIFAFLLLFITIVRVAGAESLEITVPLDKGARLRVAQVMPVNGENTNVLVVDKVVPKGSVLRVDLTPLQYQWVINAQNKLAMSGPPFFAAELLSVPAGTVPNPRDPQVSKQYYVVVGDADPAQIVATLFPDSLPDGAVKVPFTAPWDHHNPSGTWSYAVVAALNRSGNSALLSNPPKDVTDFCPKYAKLSKDQRSDVWISIAALIANLESEFVPLDATDEGAYNVEMKGVISAGLLQLSIDSVGSSCYVQRGCAIHENADLFDPIKNLNCGIAIMSCLAQSDGCISCKVDDSWYGIARYWSTLRDPYWVTCPTCAGGKVQVGHKKDIQESLKTLTPFCF